MPFHSQDLTSNSPYSLLYNCHNVCFGEYGIGSTDNPLIDVFVHSHHLSA